MSPETVTGVFTIIGTVAGTVVGAALGLLGERYVRQRGELQCEIEGAWIGADTPSFGAPEVRHFEANFYNEKEVAIALWDVRMEVDQEDGGKERVAIRFSVGGGDVGVLNFPPRLAVSERMSVTAGGDTLYRIKHARRLRFVGTFPGGKEYSRELPDW